MRNCLRIFQLIYWLLPFFSVILLFFVIRCLIGRGLCFLEIFLTIFHIVFGWVVVLILLIYSSQHFFFVSFIVLQAFALFCLYSMQFFVIGSFLNFLKAAFLCWIAFLHSALNQGLFFLLGMEFLGIDSSAIVIRVFMDFSFYELYWAELARFFPVCFICVPFRSVIMCDYIILDDNWIMIASAYIIIDAPCIIHEAGWVTHVKINETWWAICWIYVWALFDREGIDFDHLSAVQFCFLLCLFAGFPIRCYDYWSHLGRWRV